ncbi:hypothetical protein CY34DRAFT_727327 [Suillus luteus UH-Slu-Lm8-n1]|uniref:Uncharacterized protein n=1 Tax=Suillus luteus UH-Slu-Lm8-n1 TaxID=930992 RepID=A0A0D0A4F5_9AGAM|nr:hypothetical protein CY34DRAFT_727327 [Suillus luteus UH-Slu-Lm8-n1]
MSWDISGRMRILETHPITSICYDLDVSGHNRRTIHRTHMHVIHIHYYYASHYAYVSFDREVVVIDLIFTNLFCLLTISRGPPGHRRLCHNFSCGSSPPRVISDLR